MCSHKLALNLMRWSPSSVLGGAGSCLLVLPEYVVREEVALGTLRALPVADRAVAARTLKLAWPAGKRWTPVARAFVPTLQVRLPVLGGGGVMTGKWSVVSCHWRLVDW